MNRIIAPLRYSKNLTGTLRNSPLEMPFTVSLALSGVALQAYASYMLVTTGKLATFMNYNVKE